MFEGMIENWRDNPIAFGDLGLSEDHPLAKDDLVAGEPAGFQSDLLRGIRFLKYRASRVGKEHDKIQQLADVFYNVVTTAYQMFNNYVFAGGADPSHR